MKYFMIEEINEWEDDSHLMCFPYEDEIQVFILKTVLDTHDEIEERHFRVVDYDLSREDIQTAIDIIGCSFDNYFDALSIEQEIDISDLIASFVTMYYRLVRDDYDERAEKEERRIYKGGIPHNYKKA